MIKFFRHIRQNTIKDNLPAGQAGRTSKYLKYAIGEIILVVIGILIALNINNWNEKQKQDAKIVNTLKEIQSDILVDLKASNMIFDYQVYTDSIAKGVFNNTITVDDYRSGNMQRIGYNYRDFKIVTNGFDNLKGNIDDVPEKYAALLPEIKNLYVRLKVDIDVANDKIRNTVYKNVDDSYNLDGSQEALKGIVTEAEAEYYAHNIDYKNLVASYMNYRVNIFRLSNEYRVAAIDLYLKIHDAIGSKDTIPEGINYHYKKTTPISDYTGNYHLKETVNTFWPKTITIKETEEGKLLFQDGETSPMSFFYYNETTFFSEYYYEYVVFNRPEKGQFYISPGANYFAIYEKSDSK